MAVNGEGGSIAFILFIFLLDAYFIKIYLGKKEIIINVTDNLFLFPSKNRENYLQIPLNSIFGISKQNILNLDEKTGKINYTYQIIIHSSALENSLTYKLDTIATRDRLYLMIATLNKLQ